MAPALVMLVLLAAVVVGGVLLAKKSKAAELARKEAELAPVRRLVEEDVTVLGTELQDLDLQMAGRELDAGANADFQRALDSYESSKRAAAALSSPDEIRNVTEIIEDGRYAIACVQARVAGEPLPTRRPPCFFDPRHGLSVTDVDYAPEGGQQRPVPACALDAERVRAGAQPDARMVMSGTQRVPYWQGGRAYQPYAQGYYGGFGPMEWMFMGMLFSGGFGELGEGLGGLVEGIGDGIGGIAEGIGDGIGGIADGLGDFFDF